MINDISHKKINLTSSIYENREGLVYARVSSKRQEMEGSGLQSQEGRCISDLNVIGVPHKKTFQDSFTGGGDFMRRPAMRELIAYIDAHPHKEFVVVFDDLKRFARDVEFHLKLRAAFKARNVLLRCLNYNFDESPEGKFAEIIMAAQSELERHQNSRQVIQKQRARLEAGYWPFGGKKGYLIVKSPMHGKYAIPDPIQGIVLKEALEGFATGIFVRKVDACAFLVEHGFWKKQKPARYIDKFAAILKDPFYVGDVEYLPWEVERRPGKHEGIISSNTFQLIQKRLGKSEIGKQIRVDISDDFPMRGITVCGSCNMHLTAAWSKGRKGHYAYYFCQNTSCVCYRKSIKKKDIEDGFATVLKKNILKDEVDKLLLTVFDRVWGEESSNIKKQHANKEVEKERLEEKIRGLTDIAFKTISDEVRGAYEQQIEESVKELKKIKEESVQKVDLDVPYRTALTKAKTFLKTPYIAWENSSTLEKQQLFYFVFDQKIPYEINQGYRTTEIPSAIRLFEEFATANPLDVEHL
ncbi:MAG TPA: recombinase family protein [Candidatus Paceibacterota bacterium]